jgi:ribulose-phosphate 3-epimerase
MPLIAPSILSADFLNLGRDVEMINNSQADWFHCDVMDGSFVPNISFGLPILSAVKKIAKKPLDVHLMIVKPENYIADFKKAGADWLTVHQEASIHLDRTLHAIKEAGMKAGVSLNPGTPVESLREVIGICDLVLVMSVNPGFGGQKYINYCTDKVRRLKEMIVAQGSSALIEVDGGVNMETGAELVRAGADALVAGNFVFGSADPTAAIAGLKKL